MTTTTLDLNALVLRQGSHSKDSGELCLMEAVAYWNNEPHSYQPQCACPVLTAFGVVLNDAWSKEDRQRLKPFIPKLVGTRSTPAVEHGRSMMALDWLVRFYTSAWLELVPALREDAAKLRALAPIIDLDTAKAAGDLVRPVRDRSAAAGAAAWDAARAAARAAAWDAARDAAWDAARDAAWAAAWAAAWDAAWAAAGDAARAAARDAAWAAARDAAWAAAWDAAWDAARDAAWDAARDAAWAAAGAAAGDAAKKVYNPIVKRCQDSALDLLQRMIDVRE